MITRKQCRLLYIVVTSVIIVYIYKYTNSSPLGDLVAFVTITKNGNEEVSTAIGKTVKHSTKESNTLVMTEENYETNVSMRFKERRLSVEVKCAALNLPQKYVKLVTGHAPAHLTLCVVPKAACTQWLRLFTFLMNKDSSNRAINDYSKYIVHVNPGKPYARYNFNGKDKAFISTSVRVLTTRDPYTRLWSAYVDKLFLVDFWTDKGKQIINMVRPNASSLSKRCGNDVTFPEFIQYVIQIGHSMAYWGFDYHWLPVTDICDPCVFKPAFIVKQETFLQDFTHLVDHVGLIQFAKQSLEVDQDNYEIETEIDYNFKMYYKFSKCFTKFELATRIWKAMQWNGYLQPDDELPAQLVEESVNTSTVLEMVRSARRHSTVNRKTKKALRRQALVDAYRQLSDEQLQALQKLYQYDFELFGYNSTPPT